MALLSILLTAAPPIAAKQACMADLALKPTAVEQVYWSMRPKAKPGWCSGNAYFQLRELIAKGEPIDKVKVLAFYNSGEGDFRLWGTEEHKLNAFHVTLYANGLVYDVHSEHSEPESLNSYIADMFFKDGAPTADSALWNLIHVREFSAADYMKLFKESASRNLRIDPRGIERGSLRQITATLH